MGFGIVKIKGKPWDNCENMACFLKHLLKKHCTGDAHIYIKACLYSEDSKLIKSRPLGQILRPQGGLLNIENYMKSV